MHSYFTEAGQYFLFVEIDWVSEESERQYVMSSYGITPIAFYGIDSGYVPYQNKAEFLKKVYLESHVHGLQKCKQDSPFTTIPNLRTYSGHLPEGYFLLIYSNSSLNTYDVTVTCHSLRNITIVLPSPGQLTSNLHLGPGEKGIILGKR